MIIDPGARDEIRMSEPSVLFPSRGARVVATEDPDIFRDLNLDQVFNTILSGFEEYELRPYMRNLLRGVDEVAYRHEVFRDLERPAIRCAVQDFCLAMRAMRDALRMEEKLSYKQQKEWWFLDAVATYCGAVREMARRSTGLPVVSRGLRALLDYLVRYAASERFQALEREVRALREGLDDIRYAIHIKGNRVSVMRYAGEPDYSAEITELFARFHQGTVEDHRVRLGDSPDMDSVEARVVELVARLYPDVFRALEAFRADRRDYLDAVLATFDREIQFYVAYLSWVERLRAHGLPFCYPEVSETCKEIEVREGFDLALALKLEHGTVVRNDFFLRGLERILVVTGPNNGGKTTFARMVGQLHYLAGLGLPVPAAYARLILPDRVFTHFEREEDLATLRGKLDDELVRIRDILQHAGERSVIVMNESFSSTALRDALYLGTKILRRVIDIGAIGVYVTFVDQLAALAPQTVSMVGVVDPSDPARRTYRFERRPADGRAYALAVAEKYGLTYERLRKRIAS